MSAACDIQQQQPPLPSQQQPQQQQPFDTATTTTDNMNERTTLRRNYSPTASTQQMIEGVGIFGKKLLVISVINFCWSAYRVINYSFSFDDNHSEYETDKVHYLKCSLGLIFNTLSVVASSLLCYAAFYADALKRNGRLLLLPYIIWQPILICFEIGFLSYLIVTNKDNIPDDVVIYSIGCILLLALYFGVCLQMRYFRNIAKANKKKLRNFAAISTHNKEQITSSSSKKPSSYTSFRDVLPVY